MYVVIIHCQQHGNEPLSIVISTCLHVHGVVGSDQLDVAHVYMYVHVGYQQV